MPLQMLGDDWADTVWDYGGGGDIELVFTLISPTMQFGYLGNSPKQIGLPLLMTPDKKFSNGGVIGIPFYLPGGKDNSVNKDYVQVSIAGTKITNRIVGIVKDTRSTSNDIYLVLVSQDPSWISITKIRNLITRFREAVSSGAVSVAGAIHAGAMDWWEKLPAWLRWIFENPGKSVAIAAAIYFAPWVLSTGARYKSAYKHFKNA